LDSADVDWIMPAEHSAMETLKQSWTWHRRLEVGAMHPLVLGAIGTGAYYLLDSSVQVPLLFLAITTVAYVGALLRLAIANRRSR